MDRLARHTPGQALLRAGEMLGRARRPVGARAHLGVQGSPQPLRLPLLHYPPALFISNSFKDVSHTWAVWLS